MRKLRAVFAMVLVAAAAILGLGAPAGASPHGSLYTCYMFDGHIICVPVAVNWGWRWDCPNCGVMVDWGNDQIINPKVEGEISKYLTVSLQDLGQAAISTDRAEIAKLRADAVNQATSAARLAGRSQLKVAQVGSVDMAKLVFNPSPVPWLQASGEDQADAVTLLQSALADPKLADRYRTLAAAQLDEAYDELATQKAIG